MASWCLSSATCHTLIVFSIELVFLTLIFLAFWRKARRILERSLEWSKPRVWKIRIWCKRGSCTHVWSGEGGGEQACFVCTLIQQYAHMTLQKYLYSQATFQCIGQWRPPPSSGNTTHNFHVSIHRKCVVTCSGSGKHICYEHLLFVSNCWFT
jgi:hypothetical protein